MRTVGYGQLAPGLLDRSRPLTTLNRQVRSLNLTIDFAATDFTIAQDLCDQFFVVSTICQRFQYVSVATRSKPGRGPIVSGKLKATVAPDRTLSGSYD